LNLLRLNLAGSIFLGIAATCAIISGFCIFVEIGEINRKVPESEQISYIGMHPAKMSSSVCARQGTPKCGALSSRQRLSYSWD
jgi:hypothetical protein